MTDLLSSLDGPDEFPLRRIKSTSALDHDEHAGVFYQLLEQRISELERQLRTVTLELQRVAVRKRRWGRERYSRRLAQLANVLLCVGHFWMRFIHFCQSNKSQLIRSAVSLKGAAVAPLTRVTAVARTPPRGPLSLSSFVTDAWLHAASATWPKALAVLGLFSGHFVGVAAGLTLSSLNCTWVISRARDKSPLFVWAHYLTLFANLFCATIMWTSPFAWPATDGPKRSDSSGTLLNVYNNLMEDSPRDEH